MKKLDEPGWARLLRHIENNSCTPVIGAGASAAVVPAASELAKSWAKEYEYPLADDSDLARVSQFLTITQGDAMYPNERMLRELRGLKDVDLTLTPYPYLAQLPFSLYITTNYDDLISRALRPGKSPAIDYCRWNNYEEIAGKKPPGRDHDASEAQPLVYHLHGHADWPASLVLTEEDYLDFLCNAAETSQQRSDFLRPDVRTALAGNSRLFIGYRLSDWTLRVLFRGLARSIRANLGRPSVAIQLEPTKDEVAGDMLPQAQDYLQKYFGRLHRGDDFHLYWGDATAFAKELAARWNGSDRGDV